MLSGQSVSVVGSQASKVAYPLLVLAMTGSAARAGLAGAAATLPYLLFPLVAGVLADRISRKLIMIGCDVLRLAALGSIALAAVSGALRYEQVLVAGFAEGTGSVFFMMAQRGAIPMLVHESQRAHALAQNEARTYGAQLAGPPLGGALFSLWRGLPFAFDALSYVASLITLPFIKQPLRASDQARGRNPLRDLVEGVAWTWRRPFLRIVSVLAGSLNLCLQVLGLAVIVLARDRGASPAMTGVVVGCMGIGGIGGAMAAPWIQRTVQPGIVITADLCVLAGLTALLAAAGSPGWMCPVSAAIGFAGPLWNVAAQTYRLRITPNEMLARVSSVSIQIAWGVMPAGSLLAGVLLSRLPAATVIAVTAAGIAVIAVSAAITPAVRGAGGPRDVWMTA